MVIVTSQRGNELLKKGAIFQEKRSSSMIKLPPLKWRHEDLLLWIEVKKEGPIIKEIFLFDEGHLKTDQKILLMAIAILLSGKNMMVQLSLREIDAFLRDRNTVPALEGTNDEDEIIIHRLVSLIKESSFSEKSHEFKRGEMTFKNLTLVEKTKCIKAFLQSEEILNLYQDLRLPHLIDIDEETIFLSVPYSSEREKNAFSKLHEIGVEVFGDENINFIPEE